MAYLTGFHVIEELIRSGKAKGPLLVANAGPRARTIMSLATDNKIRIDRVGEYELNRLAPGNRGIALYVEGKDQSNETTVQDFLAGLEEGQDALVVVLDGITDPHNYGAILRSCDQFGADLVIVANRRSAKDAEVVSKTSAGTVAWVPIAIVSNLVRSVEQLKDAGFWVYGADMKGEAVYDKDLRGRTVLIMGSEGSGISRLLKETCDGMVSIPTSGQVDSLNVSVAAGVLLYEARRQRAREK
ncbi:23S rRNA (guanosine(2251)-2'-O)-methyltransferase RlmB [Gracilinema caldarium]|uniref:RNA methyltransferase, TrmH family, group 3 n=1 Tax=Gracilinema caldarium (strain ATCC 51460 / DSM 7334 / H1) TaxID=744872 RepID=F8F2D8_GRAC1|nr:23S rRNA (guanosine(2251)-2'-O)-methyltransferase RlmB [Gracilinema caldarium]AEJ20920.1 RNA methyltransferase, TrmH family, group 3 [Gracilinema caldarium DSM 7334]